MAAEYVAELRENILHRETVSAAESTAWEALRPHVVAELIVFLAFLRVGEHIVGFGCLLEFLFGLLVAWIFVWVVFDSQLAVGFLKLFRCGCLRYAEHFVVISLVHLLCLSIITVTVRQPLWHDGAPCR